MHEHPHSDATVSPETPSRTRWRIALVRFAGLGALLLFYEHRPHIPFGSLLILLILTGFLVQWPTILTLAMYPVLIWMYLRLARTEEREARARFGGEYDAWAERVPAFLPWGSVAGGATS